MKADEVLEFWLGPRDDVPPDAARTARWFAADPALDREIEARFGAAVDDAIAGGSSNWEQDPFERTALIVLLDQFPRNLHRGSARAFAGDPRALGLVRRTTAAELDRLHPLEHYFAILPWMHSEVLSDQRAGEAAFERASEVVAEAFRPLFRNGSAFATRHRVVIERFGRFPHRNAAHGRVSSADELAFLAEHGTGF